MCNLDTQPSPTDPATALLKQLKNVISRLPLSVPVATQSDDLAVFSGDPRIMASSSEDGWEDLWESALDPLLNRVIGYGRPIAEVLGIIRRGAMGMDGFCRWIQICLEDILIPTSLLETKVERMIEAMNSL